MWRQAADFDQFEAERLDIGEHAIKRSLVGEHPGQHGDIAPRPSLESGKRGADRLAQAAADTDLVTLRLRIPPTGHVITASEAAHPPVVIRTSSAPPWSAPSISPKPTSYRSRGARAARAPGPASGRASAWISEIVDLLAQARGPAATPAEPARPCEALTRCEARVLRYLPTNLSTREIASELYLSVNTVKTHQRHLYQKLGARNRMEAVERARALSLFAPSSRRP